MSLLRRELLEYLGPQGAQNKSGEFFNRIDTNNIKELHKKLNPALQALPKGHEQHLRQSAVFSVTEYTEPDLHPLVAKVRLGFIG